MAPIEYRYRLLNGSELVATGHLSVEEPLEVGAELELAGHRGTVRSVEPILGTRELRLVVVIAREA
ncbi:MAG: hypothetical protein ACRD6W_00170 [Nitrososphaerales archaeon]